MKIYNMNNKAPSFTSQQAWDLTPLLKKVSMKTEQQLKQLNLQLAQKSSLETQEKINQVIQAWADNVRRLGATPFSLHKVRIAGEHCEYLWDYHEDKLFWH